ncbi:hypothetical protein BSZ36_05115 [Rubricoccus marinus]|uniref:Uncharacterized protein n=1 Tax=Rubricoccus marinus TaxID=716817 RepID=A0A259TXB8_9BACT|nr:hypothetical protein BSZ36_05115 [Rubricoccus marinus]
MARRFKQPKPQRGAHVQAPSVPEDYDKESPAFCLRHLQKGYHLDDCSPEDKASFAMAQVTRSKLSWKQLRSAHRHGLGSEKITHDSINAGIPEQITEDVTLLAFRFSGKKPMVGYREREIFRVVWLDHDFSLYDHG